MTPTHVYEHVFPGFAAVIPGDTLDDVRSDPRVAVVVPDGLVHASAQTLPTGVNRIDADTNAAGDQAFVCIGAASFSGSAGEFCRVIFDVLEDVQVEDSGKPFRRSEVPRCSVEYSNG